MRNFRVHATALAAVAATALMIAAATSSAAELPTEPKCEFIASPGSAECMLPFPDDYYTKADPTSATGRRIDFRELATPTNAATQHIEVAPYNTGDGFSPGSVIALKVPGIETARRRQGDAHRADQPPEPLQNRQRAGRRDRHEHRAALADLG